MEYDLNKINKKVLGLLPNIVRTKIKNIIGKAPVSSLCGGARISTKSRFTFPYLDLIRNGITLENLMTIKNGVVVLLVE